MDQKDEFGEASAGASGLPLAGVDPEWLSATIGSIYDCVLEPERWKATIASIAQQFSFANAVLALLQIDPGANHLTVHHGFDAEWIAAGDRYAADAVQIWGGPQRLQSYPLGEPIVCTEVTPASDFRAYAYYRDILEPRGLADAVVIGLTRDADIIGYLGLNRHLSQGRVRPQEMEGLRLLAPHLRRAVTISNLFDLKTVESSAFRSVLDGMACAVMLVDSNLQVVHANLAGRTLLAAGNILQTAQGRIGLPGRIADDALRVAVRIAGENEALMTQRGIGIPATGTDGAPAVLHVLPLQRGELRSGLSRRAVAAVFVVAGGKSVQAPVDAITALYDFTPAESQIFASLSAGTSLEKTAAALGIAKSTARTHLQRVFEKTGCKRQAELVALGASLSLTL